MKLNSIFAALICTLSFFFTSCDKNDDFEDEYVVNRTTKTLTVDVENEIKISEDMYNLYDVTITYSYDGNVFFESLNKKYLVGSSSNAGKNHSAYMVQKYTVNKSIDTDKLEITICATPKANAQEILDEMPDTKKVNLYCNAEGFVNSDYITYFNEQHNTSALIGLNKDKVNNYFANGKVVVYKAIMK